MQEFSFTDIFFPVLLARFKLKYFIAKVQGWAVSLISHRSIRLFDPPYLFCQDRM